jgi:glycosyltransferase involved in cell wall biosynthesis
MPPVPRVTDDLSLSEARAGGPEPADRAAAAPLRVLAITGLFPNPSEPGRGIFNLHLFRALAECCRLEVIAPVAWPRRGAVPNRETRGSAAPVPPQEELDGLRVHHPRFAALPALGRVLDGLSESLRLRRQVSALHAAGAVDVVLATWAYPDVVAAASLARRLGVPLIAKVHGSDVNVMGRRWPRRTAISRALRSAAAVVVPSRSLGQAVAELGVEPGRIALIPNGVDASRFRPLDRAAARRRLGLPPSGTRIVFVGNLRSAKGPDVLVEAARLLDDETAVSVVGNGPLRRRLEARIRRLGLGRRVTLAGERPHDEIPYWIAAADVVCVPSRTEGCSNVAREALACGRPVVATSVGGLPELVTGPDLGTLVPPEDAPALAAALRRAVVGVWDGPRIRSRLAGLTWETSASRLVELLRHAAAARPARSC